MLQIAILPYLEQDVALTDIMSCKIVWICLLVWYLCQQYVLTINVPYTYSFVVQISIKIHYWILWPKYFRPDLLPGFERNHRKGGGENVVCNSVRIFCFRMGMDHWIARPEYNLSGSSSVYQVYRGPEARVHWLQDYTTRGSLRWDFWWDSELGFVPVPFT